MTVMVTGASGPVGHALIPLLARKDEVRVAVRDAGDADGLRALGAKVTLDRLDDAPALAEVLGGVFTLVHLVGGPDQPDDDALWDANHRSVLRALEAARTAGVRRFLLVSVPGASPEASAPYLRAKGLAEEAVTTSGLQHAVIRSAPVVGVGSAWFAAVVAGALESPPVVWGMPDLAVAPVAIGDLAAALAVADDLDADLHGTWALEGPDVVTARELIGILSGPVGEPVSLDGEPARQRLSASFGHEVSPHLVGSLVHPVRSDAPDAAAFFGIERTPLVDAIETALASATTPGAHDR
ncbi:MAG TPA: SDR family oxidoreductase [Actinomycetota bacterium]